jgi:hypothetical protein
LSELINLLKKYKYLGGKKIKKTLVKITLLVNLIALLFIAGCTTTQQEPNYLIPGIDYDITDAGYDELEDNDHHHDHDHDHSVEIEGREMRLLTISQIAELWEIDADKLFRDIINEFNLEGNYTPDTILEEMRIEYKF